MTKSEASDSSETSSDETEAPKKCDGMIKKKMKEGISEYERQRMKRMEENRARMEALGLKKMAKSLMGSAQDVKERKKNEKGKRKVDEDDDDYRPAEDEELEVMNSSSDEDNDSDADDEEFKVSRKSKGKKITTTPKKSSTKKRVPKHKPFCYSDYVDDDDALLQAIALSLQDSAGFLNVKPQASQNATAQVIQGSSNEKKGNSQILNSTSQVIEASSNEKKGTSHIVEDTGKKKRKKKFTSRVQMTEDEIILHFFHFDEAGKGNITSRDVQRLAAAHDFMWSDKEMADMINCFDGDGDGKLELEDFRKIVGRCNMIQIPDDKTL